MRGTGIHTILPALAPATALLAPEQGLPPLQAVAAEGFAAVHVTRTHGGGVSDRGALGARGRVVVQRDLERHGGAWDGWEGGEGNNAQGCSGLLSPGFDVDGDGGWSWMSAIVGVGGRMDCHRFSFSSLTLRRRLWC